MNSLETQDSLQAKYDALFEQLKLLNAGVDAMKPASTRFQQATLEMARVARELHQLKSGQHD
jgi:hypothetical protein